MKTTLFRYFLACLFLCLCENSVKAQDSTHNSPRSFTYTEAEKLEHAERLHAEKERAIAAMMGDIPRSGSVDYSSRSVGEIPLLDGVSPSGARTYQIPIPTAGGYSFVPSVSLGYNSQASDGWMGYGWDIQGVSTITLISKNPYYHSESKGANVYAYGAAFALDGVPLVTNAQSETMLEYPLVTATGNVLVSKRTNQYGYVSQFTALYPNGVRAVYGFDSLVNFNFPSYPVTEMTDFDGNKITFVYQIDTGNGNHRLNAIRYGYDSAGNYSAEIVFNYDYYSTYVPRYYAGKQTNKLSRLSSVVSKDGNNIICKYPLSYEQKDNVYLLKQVDCVSGADSLRPLQFRYESYPDSVSLSAGFLEKKDSISFENVFSPGDTNLVYKRGKFIRGSHNDGLLIYPYYPNYSVAYQNYNTYAFSSGYQADQPIFYVPSLRDHVTPNSGLTTGDGFQTIDAVDVDGDGLDELVKVNFYSTVFTNSNGLTITVYKTNSYGTPVQNAQFAIPMSGAISSGPFFSPYRREYYWGDFLGNGKVQLLAIAYDNNYNPLQTFQQVCYASLIDIAGQTKLYDSVLFTFPENGPKRIFTCDLDNDAQTELCYVTDSGVNVYRFDGAAFNCEKTLAGVTTSNFSTDQQPSYITDVNGDGYIDIMIAPYPGPGNIWKKFIFNGDGFDEFFVSICSRSSSDTFFFMDVNYDGLADLVKISGTTLGTYKNINGSSFGQYQLSPSTISNSKGILQCNVIDRFGMSAFIKIDGTKIYEYEYSVSTPKIRHLTKSIDSYGRVLFNHYVFLPKHSLQWLDYENQVDNSQGYALKTLPIYVLQGDEAFKNETINVSYRNKDYSYFDGVIHNLGLGFCGFSKMRVLDYSGESLVMTFECRDPQKRGVTTSVIEQNSNESSPHTTVTNTYDDNYTTYGKLNPRLTQSVAEDALTGITTTTSYTYGDYDLPTSINTSSRIGTGTALTRKVKRTYENSLSTSKYVLGVVTQESVIEEGDGTSQLSWENKTVNTYDSNYHLVNSKHYVGKNGFERVPKPDTLIFRAPPGRYEADNLVSTTRRTFDSRGNVTSEKTALYGATEFVGDTLVYDSEGRYLVSKTDALGHTTTYSGYNKFGKPTSVTDYRNRTTTYTYDSWGNLTSTVYPDSGVEQTTTAWGGDGLYTVTNTATGEPETITHYDALGREIKSGVKRFDGVWQFTNREYDSRGRLSRVSLPYRQTAGVTGPSYWNRYHYDVHDRPDSLIEASGRVSLWSYSGTSVTTVKDSIAITKTTDAMGRVVSVSDLGGMVTYTLRDDGQPSSITAPGNVVTTFTYDGYGRQTQMVDPSLGTESDAYTWNADGSSQFTHANRNGTVTTFKDKYGRTTQVQRANEFNTTYTYDTYGRISSVLSTNGTGKRYTYDALDRIVSVKDSIPGGKWLQKGYYYSAGSVVDSIRYVSHSGYITTERYSYANGHNTGIMLPGNITVWTLTDENDLGQPTEIYTGPIKREYGYTSYGLPFFRKMDQGALQEFSYEFDPKTGNLLSRSGYLPGEESFAYDSLGRLKTITRGQTTRHITFAPNGNITSIDGVGTLIYGGGTGVSPYEVTGLTPEAGQPSYRQRTVTYNSFDRPATISESAYTATLTYNAEGDKVRTFVTGVDGPERDLVYIGGRYEYDSVYGPMERLYLGGDAYSAPMVLVKIGAMSWTPYQIGRDYLGSITQIADLSGNSYAQYRYDPWGRMVNVSTGAPYAPGSEPTLFLGRGFTSHEYLPWFGLINANARLYDPLLGRFLSPDPYVQDPDFSQNYNRYSYCLNNPLKYTDESGEVLLSALLVSMGIGAIVNIAFNWGNIDNFGEGLLVGLMGAGAGAVSIVSGGASFGVQLLLSTGLGFANAATNNAVKQLGASGDGTFDSGLFWRASLSGAVTSAASVGANKLINSGWISKVLDKMSIDNSFARNVVGNAIEGSVSGLITGAANGIGTQYVENGLSKNWDWNKVGNSILFGSLLGGSMGAFNGVVQEGMYQRNLSGKRDIFANGDVADAFGERSGDILSNLESSELSGMWPLGHNYANETYELAGSICIGISTGRCTITIDPYAPMVPTCPTYIAPKP